VTSRRNHLLLVGLILAALVGVALLAVPGSPAHKKPTLGLDLQGGLEVVLQAVPPKGHKLTAEDLDRSVDIMRNRVDKLGVSEPEIRKQSGNQIVIELAGVHDAATAASIIGKTAQLELYDLESSVTGPSKGAAGVVIAKTSLYDLLSPVQAKAAQGTPDAYYVFADKKLVAGPIAGSKQAAEKILAKKKAEAVRRTPQAVKPKPKQSAKAKAKAAEKPQTQKKEGPPVFKLLARPENTAVVTCDSTTSEVCPGLSGLPVVGQTYYYLFEHDLQGNPPVPQMTGNMLDLGGTRADVDPSTNQPVVLMKFTGKGNKAFRDITRAEAQRGRALGTPQHFAVVLDNQIRTWPQINYDELPNGIDPTGSGAQITGLSSASEAKSIALVLQTGALPVKFNTVERTDVSATLGKDSLSQAYRAAIAGLILVVISLLVFYRFLGLVAVIGLGIYAAFLYAAILLFNVTLTLPGFAGMILTIGVAADANIVIFERIKEEFRAGKSVRAAVGAGYAKGFHTIVDANVVTAITALVLFAVSTSSVKGFALMLLIGTAISLVTAVAATRAMLGLLAGFKWFHDPRFMGATAAEIPRWQRIDVVGRRRLWFILSLVAIGLSIVAVAVKGLNLGIDFKGGTQVTFNTQRYTSLDTVRSKVRELGAADQVQGRGQSEGGNYKSFQIRTKSLSSPQQNRVQRDLTERVGAQSLQIKSVSASFSRQILESAIIAILVSFALIAVYVSMRYQWRFAVPILRTLFNDVLITVGIYAVDGREVSVETVAAILTILGFSIYDTIIVFDRIRENIKLMPRASIATIANVSVWEVLRRSMMTSFVTLLPIVALFFFGGGTLKDFAFAIIVGILIGAVSTIFVATPLVTVLLERQPEFHRRIGREGFSGAGAVGVSGVGAASDGAVLARAEAAAAAEPAPTGVATPIAAVEGAVSRSQEKRERRKQRRRSRPHGRAR
jgi:SecD/SecF fusion protein